MKKGIGWVVSLGLTMIGFVVFIVSQTEISNNTSYTWRPPYTTYETQVVITKWVGILILISGICWFALLLFQAMYTNKHTQDITELTSKGGAVKCQSCGLSIAANISVCPRCGQLIGNNAVGNEQIASNSFCAKCGNKVNSEESFCPKCGSKIN